MSVVQLVALNAAVPRGGDPPNQKYSVFSGNTVDLEFLITDQEGGPLDLTGATIQYHLRQTAGAELAGFPKNAAISTAPDGAGKCTVRLLSTETASIVGTFQHIVVVIDNIISPAAITTVCIGSALFKSDGV